jgi:hypothetical protein
MRLRPLSDSSSVSSDPWGLCSYCSRIYKVPVGATEGLFLGEDAAQHRHARRLVESIPSKESPRPLSVRARVWGVSEA